MDRSDEELIAAHVRGDIDAFPELLERYLKQIYTFAYRLGAQSEAEDIAQETFIKAWKNIKKYRRQSAQFRTWLFRIARNTTIDFLRKKKHIPFSEFDTDEGNNTLLDTLADEMPLPDTLYAEAETAERLQETLNKLPPRAREVLLLRYTEGLTFEEIREVLEEPLNTVKSRHRRALQALQKLLQSTNQEEP